ERVHPGDDAEDAVVGPGLDEGAFDRLRVGQDRLPDDPDGNVLGCVECAGQLLWLLGDLIEGLRAVETLAAGEEPDLLALEWIAHVNCSFAMSVFGEFRVRGSLSVDVLVAVLEPV